MTRRFWWSLVADGADSGVHGVGVPARASRCSTRCRRRAMTWSQFLLATPVVLWGGWPFFVRGWASVVNRHLNMFTLIALGVGAAYVYSVVATLAPGLFPASFRTHGDQVGVYFEPAAVIVVLVLLGQVLELRARSRTSRRDPEAARPRAEDGAAHRRRRRRARTCRSSTCTSAIACASGPANGAGRRRRRRGPHHGRRVDGDRRADSGREGGRRAGDGRHRQRHRHVRDARPSASAATRCSRRSCGWSARRSGHARRFSGWPTPSPAGSCRSSSLVAVVTFVVWAVWGPSRGWRTPWSTPSRC